MKLSESFFYTIRENISDEDSVSGQLLVKSGMIKKTSNGIYLKMPLGLKVINNITNIVRKHMDNSGANELEMPLLLPIEFFERTGRKENFGDSMFSLKDRYNRNYALGPTHEELFVFASSSKINSYRDLPFTIYQIGTKFRDEIRPRLGLIRIREFIMKDAYSFDTSYEALDVSYNKMFEAYKNIFDEVGLDYVVVKADTGAMGGILSEEFQAISETGEDILISCEECNYSSNIEIAKCMNNNKNEKEEQLEIEEVYTPNAGRIEDVTNYLNLPASKFVKTMVYKAGNDFYACMVEADREINETKLSKILNVSEVKLAEPEEVNEITKAQIGFAGPVGISIPVIMDEDIRGKKNFIVGANKTNYHLKNVNLSDFETYIIEDIKKVKEGDCCPHCGKKFKFKKGIEVGNTFKLGTKYSESLDLNYIAEDNKKYPVIMGCYGIGIERIMAAVVEQNHDENGIIWPMNIAPYKVTIVLINPKDKIQKENAENLYKELNNMGIETLLDDRNERPGVKFNDMDLIGIPIRVTVGKKIAEGIVELKERGEKGSKDVNIIDIKNEIKELVKNKIS